MNLGPQYMQEFNDPTAWQVLFEALLADHLSHHPMDRFSVQVSDQEISLFVSSSELLSVVNELMYSPAVIRKKLQYKVSEKFEEHANEIKVPDMPRLDYRTLKATQVLPKLFSPALLGACGLSTDLLSLIKYEDQAGSLSIPLETFPGFDQLWQARLQILKNAIATADLTTLRKAYMDKGPGADITTVPTVLKIAPALEGMLGIRDKKGGGQEFFFHYGAFLSYLFPPAPQTTLSASRESGWHCQIKFNRKGLMQYLSKTFTEGFVLKLSPSGAIPVCLPSPLLKRMPNLYSVVLDFSSSMSPHLAIYKEQVHRLIDALLANCEQGDVLRLVCFDAKTTFEVFPLPVERKQIEKFLSFSLGNSTRLYGSVFDELGHLEEYAEYNKSLIVFTDGEENVLDVSVESLNQKLAHMTLEPSYFAPKVFTLGLGQAPLEELQKWADHTGVTALHLQGMEEFKLILNHLERIRRPRLLSRFIQGLTNIALSIYEDTPAIPTGIALQPEEPFSFGNRSFTYSATPHLALAPPVRDALHSTPTLTPHFQATTQATGETVTRISDTATSTPEMEPRASDPNPTSSRKICPLL